jgi:long-chain acyl-CoA synthetase
MARRNLLNFFDDLSLARGIFLSYDDGYRNHSYSYEDVTRAARAFAGRLGESGISAGDKVLIWGENRPEWIVAFWGCLLVGAIVVPIDYRASAAFVGRVWKIVDGRLLLCGDDVTENGPADGMPDHTRRWKLSDLDWHGAPPAVSAAVRDAISLDSTAEIIFTSGATAEPKGVIITHRNILANVEPVEREVLKYRKYGRPFFPLRFLNLLPLSHMFGQAMATFIPPMLAGEVVFIRSYNPNEIVHQVHQRRISVLVSVPKILDVLSEHVRRLHPETREQPNERRAASVAPAKPHWLRRWWRYRNIHREFGLKFWCFVVGAAPLEPALEEFWSALGFLVVQGYGLTETAPIVTLNHPFKTRRGSVGKAIAGVQVKIAPDGEILVRGENVTSGYFQAPDETARAFEDGWFHTGDIGEIDASGQLFIRGRKKEMIVTPEGLNVFPEDVERVLNALPGVREAAVVGVTQNGQERVHAVLVLEKDIEADQIVHHANAQLADHQRIRRAHVWPAAHLPRTEGTAKLKRRELKQWVETGAEPAGQRSETASLSHILERYTGGRTIAPGTTLGGLGLSSLERVELMVALEDAFHTRIDETAFSEAGTVDDLQRLVTTAVEQPTATAETWEFPSWNTRPLSRAIRRASLTVWLLPLTRVFAWIRTEGLEHLDGLEGPVIFAANHQSHMDTPVIMAALPPVWRYRLAPAMAKEFFKAHFFPEQFTRREWFTNSLNYYLSTFFFNAFPLPQREAGARQTLRYVGELLGRGFSVLIFPEGRRTERGEINPFRPGIGMMAAKLEVAVVPVRLVGLDRVLHPSWRMARPGRVIVKFGQPLRFDGQDYDAMAKQVETAVRAL